MYRENNHKKQSPGHFAVLQICDSTGDPSLQQSCPPFAGGGLVHARERYFIPPSHDLLHALQLLHCE